MGNRCEVWAYLPCEDGYDYFLVHGGQSLLQTLLAARKAKLTAGCVKVMWR